MSYFKNICLLKAPQIFDIPHPQDISDLTEICYLAAMIENEVDSVSIPTNFHDKRVYKGLLNHLKMNPVDLVGISSMTGAFNNAMRLAEIAKRFDKYVVMGGYHPTALYDDVLQSPYVDAVIIGEGEKTFKELVVNGPSKEVAGMAFKDNGRVVVTDARPVISDLDCLPQPLRTIRPARFGEVGDDYSIDTVYTSRGCPWNCSFCANDTINKQWRGRSPENVLEELTMLHDARRKKLIKIWDANFLTDVKRVETICDLMIENDITNFKIWTETRVDDIIRAERIMDKLYRIGLRHLSLGIESPNQDTLELMKKKTTKESCFKAVEILRRNKIKAQGYFIIGHYTETVEDTKRYPEFAEALGLRHAIFMVMTPYPGTAIFDEYKKEDKIRSFDWDLYNNFCTVVETKGMDIKTLNKMYIYCWGRFYVKFAFLYQGKSFGIIVTILQWFLLFCPILEVAKKYTEEEIAESLVDFLRANLGREISKPRRRKPPLLLRWFKHITIRFSHSSGKNVDFNISQKQNSIHLFLEETDDTGLVRGPIIRLNDVMKLYKRISPEMYMAIACKLEPIKNNPERRARSILSQLNDKKLILPALTIGWFVFRYVFKGIVSIFLHSVTSRSRLNGNGLH
ncbi:B12-binding domain-containing radical SAM protein [Candidatus Bathyarchaeota archaeon]|nr:B12-binding domain-containing radical SAM protein [Candidatus Bathyarchaeota archaeon]